VHVYECAWLKACGLCSNEALQDCLYSLSSGACMCNADAQQDGDEFEVACKG
jgi:hypothetical protein